MNPHNEKQYQEDEFDQIVYVSAGQTESEEFDFDFDYDPNEMYWALLNDQQ